MKEIKLTHGFVTWVDDEDFASLSAYRWHTWLGKDGHAYAARYITHPTSRPKGRQCVMMHRVILGVLPDEEVDHIKLFASDKVIDNRRRNLRVATSIENGQSRRKHKPGTSIFKGVIVERGMSSRPWRARIRHGGRLYHLGCFSVEAHAALAYDLKAMELFDEFALTNFPVPGSKNWLFGEVSP